MLPELRRVARRQGGAFTRRQAQQLGTSQGEVVRNILDGEWIELVGDVLVCAGTPITDELKAWTGVLAIGQPVALAGCFAGGWLGLEQVPAVELPELVVPPNRRYAHLPRLRVRRYRDDAWTVIWHRQLPVTPIAPTIRDIAASVPRPVLRDVVQHALRRRRVNLAQLEQTLGRGRTGSAALRSVLREVAPGYQVVWERRLHQALLRRGVQLTPQLRVDAPGGRCAYLDLGDAELRFGVEIDGFVNHMARFAADRRRGRMLAVELGWTIATYAAEDLAQDLDRVADEIVAYIVRLRARRTA